MGIDPKGLRNFRADKRERGDPDETEGRAIYRANADVEARRSIAMTRAVKLRQVTEPPSTDLGRTTLKDMNHD